MTTDQASAVYAAEDLWMRRHQQTAALFGDWNEIWPFYFALAERCTEHGREVKPPSVKPRKGALKAHYDNWTKTVHIPPYAKGGVWALNVGTAIHEFAHHLSPGTGHGPAFREAMLFCLKALGWQKELEGLEQAYSEAGLGTTDKGDGMIDKVAKLMSHAEGASTPEEKMAFIEKAEALASEHAINLAMLRKRQADDKGDRDRPTESKMYSLRMLPSATYRKLTVTLGTCIIMAHGGASAIYGGGDYMIFYGFPEDIELTELMLTRITPMMFEAADEHVTSVEFHLTGVAKQSGRIEFCNSFAYEINRRLREVVKATARRMEEEQLAIGDGEFSTAIVLRDKELEVADYVAYEFKRKGVKGTFKGSRSSTLSGTATEAGRAAAREVNLYGRKEIGS